MVVYCSFSSGPIWVLLKPSGLLAEQPSTMYKICQNKSKYHRIVEVTQQSYESCQYHSRRVVRSERFLTDLRSMQFSQRSSANQPWNLEHPQHKHHQLQRKTLIDQYSFMYNRKQDHQTMASSSHFITRSCQLPTSSFCQKSASLLHLMQASDYAVFQVHQAASMQIPEQAELSRMIFTE